jgi:hypothetical protein
MEKWSVDKNYSLPWFWDGRVETLGLLQEMFVTSCDKDESGEY